jgi:hypothetical protein
MALNTNPFIEGINPTATFGGYASVLLQLIRQAIPSSTYGMVLFDTTAPDVTGSNAWRKTCVWLNLTNPNIPTVNVYKEGTSPGWINVNNIIGNGAITTAMIANGAVTLPKLSTSGGTALQLIRVNATATAFEFVSLASLVTVGSIPIGSLITTGIPPGEMRYAGVVGPGTATWYTPIQIINNLPDSSINPDLLGVPGALTSRSQFLTARTADTFASYRYFEPNVDMLNATMNGAKLQDATVGPEKIFSTAVPDGYLLGKVAGVPNWVPPLTVAGATTKYVDTVAQTLTQNLPAYGVTLSIAHPLAQMPTTYRVALYCAAPTAFQTYIIGDEIDLATVNQGVPGDWWIAFTVQLTSSAVVLRRFAPGTIQIPDKTTVSNIYITEANWRLRLYATYTS